MNTYLEESGRMSPIDALPADVAIIKMENEQIFAAARVSPREPAKVLRQLTDLIEAYPAAADEAIYSKPVGTVQQITCSKCKIKYEVSYIDRKETSCPGCDAKYDEGKDIVRKVKKFAEGLSIRAAESIRSAFGYTRLATTTESLEDGRVKITGILVDYCAGNVTSDDRIVSPFYKAKNGHMTRTPEDRFLNVVVKAEKSKLRRDVILDSTPAIVKAMFRDACENKLKDLVAPEVIEQKILPAFAEYGISVEQLDQIVGRPRSLGWREDERLELRKILNALKNEETTVRELVEGLDDTAKPASGKLKPSVSMDDLTNPKGQTEKSPHEKNDPSEIPNPPDEEESAEDWESQLYEDLKKCASLGSVDILWEEYREKRNSEDDDVIIEMHCSTRKQQIRDEKSKKANG